MKPSPSLVVASLALFVSLSGTSYAVSQLPPKSVGSKQLKPNAVTGIKVKDGSLMARDFRPGQLLAGPVGQTGPAGPQGPPGRSATSQSGGASAVRSPSYEIPSARFTHMFSLTEFADVSTGALTIDRPSRLVLHGSVTVRGVYNIPRPYACRFEIRDTGPWAIAGSEIFGLDGRDYTNSVSWQAVVDVPPGARDVRIACKSESVDPAAFGRGHFTVIVTDR